MEEKAVALWSTDMELSLIASYTRHARNKKFVASGGKNLRQAGWKAVLADLDDDRITTAGQLQSKWRRLKADWNDYELDATRGKIKLSRFRAKPYLHCDAMSAVIGDSMANGENILPLSQCLSHDDENLTGESTQLDDIDDLGSYAGGDITAAQKRATVLNHLKKNRKRKSPKSETNLVKSASKPSSTFQTV
ncbi:hypothetical protein AC1031_006741 [Aphanomyces cochlioides]|nr:hypothetical protein AC1031_006741 [Aphanomyces cochlioides]